EKSFIPLHQQADYLYKDGDERVRLGRIEIDPRWIPKLRYELDECGITAASIYPDFGGICQRITERVSRSFSLDSNL
ncbi:MAG TPA: hypothetical protein VG722_00025, partial [Tepidisphaeraceae bacterium]|nr:hypothetical protein [Tepidisphaeraceae bacterium]